VIVLGPAIGLVGLFIGLFAAAFSVAIFGGAIFSVGIFGPVFSGGFYIPFSPIVSIP